MKKTMIWIFTVALFLSVLSGCSTDKNNKETSVTSTPTSAPVKTPTPTETIENEKYHYTLCVGNYGPYESEKPTVIAYMEDFLGDVEFELIYVENTERQTKVNMLIAGGTMPDVLGTVDQYAMYKEDIIGSWDEQFFRESAPDYSVLIDTTSEEYGLDGWAVTKFDGERMYTMPGFRINNAFADVVVWRDDWLTELGINKIPETLNEAEEAFYAITQDDPDGNGKDDTYGLSSGAFNSIYGAFGTMRKMWIENSDGTLSYGDTLEGAKQATAQLAKWYADGVLDPEFINSENEGGYWAVSTKFNTGRIGYTGYANWYHWHPDLGTANFNAGGTLDFIAQNPDGSFKIGVPPIGPNGERGTSQADIRQLGTVFSKSLVDDTDRFARLLQVYNTLYTDKDLFFTNALGIEGTHWFYGEYDGKEIVLIDENNSTLAQQTAIGGLPTITTSNEGPSLELQTIRYGGGIYWAQENLTDINYGYVNRVFSNSVLPSAAEYTSELATLMDEGFISIITGDQPIEYFDKMVSDWYKFGGEVLTKEANDWYSMQ